MSRGSYPARAINCAPRCRPAVRTRGRIGEGGAEAELRALRDDTADASADDRAEDRTGHLPHLILAGLACLRGAVAQQDMAQFVSHHSHYLALAVRRFDHAAIDEHRPARQRKRVDFADVHRFERVPELGMLELAEE